jgi:hypothetical protein
LAEAARYPLRLILEVPLRIGSTVLVALALIVSAMPPSGAQTPIQGVVTNVRSTVTGGTVEIRYDLASPQAGLAFDVTIVASEDGGASFPIKLSSVTGDAGPGIIPGTSKRAVWNAARDVERAAFDRFQYRITATAIPRVAPPQSKPGAGQPAPAAAPPPPSGGGGGGKKWLLIGGGVAAAGAAAAFALKPGSSPPTIGDVGLTGLTEVLLATANSVTFRVSGSSPDGEALQASWTFGDGTTAQAALSSGSATVVKRFTTAGSFTPRVTVSAPRGGSATRDYQIITVATATGRWTGRYSQGNFSFNLTQNGSQLTGDGVIDFASNFVNPGQVSGSVGGPPSRMTFGLADRDGRRFPFEVTGSGDQRTFTGTVGTAAGDLPFSMTRQ